MSGQVQSLQEHIDTNFGGNSRLFEAMGIIDQICTEDRLDEIAFKEFVYNRWLIYLNSVDGFPTLIERFWWSIAFETAGMSFNEIVFKPYLRVMVEKYWEQFKEGFEQSKTNKIVPYNIKTPEEYLALIFAPTVTRPYTNDPVLQVLDVKTGGELETLHSMEFNFKLAKMVVDGTFVKLHNASYHDEQRAYERQGVSKKTEYVSEYTGLELGEENNIEYLSDDDRLSQFCELVGVDMDALTDGEANRLIDLLHALDPNIGGYELASKTGISLAAYYGDRADSEKTQRQRLFKKIKEASDKTK